MDLILVEDQSGSLDEEAIALIDGLTELYAAVQGADIDLRIVLLGQCRTVNFTPISVASPLGTGANCPGDANPPLLTRVNTQVEGSGVFWRIENTFADWQGVLRGGAAKMFLILTDDDAAADDPADDFLTWLDTEPAFADAPSVSFSGMFCATSGSNCAAVGTQYSAVATATGGVVVDIATVAPGELTLAPFIDAILDRTADQPCTFRLTYEELDPDYVNVRLTTPSDLLELVNVTGESACAQQGDGWYFTSSDTVALCPESCSAYGSTAGAQLQALHGCDTLSAP